MSTYEIVGFAFGLLSVVLIMHESVWSWPVGLVSVVSFGLLFLEIRLYADMALQGFYVATGIIGWRQWLRGGEGGSRLRLSRLSTRSRWLLGLAILPCVPAMAWGLATFIDSSLPLWDSLASTLSVFAQILLMRKIFETWALWIAVDVLSIGIYMVKGVHLTAVLYAVFLVLACLGLREWRHRLRKQDASRDAG